MSTDCLFRDDSYLKECSATVIGLTDAGEIMLDRTVFYAASGGGVENGAIEHDLPRIGETNDGGGALLEIRVVAEQALGGHDRCSGFAGRLHFHVRNFQFRSPLQP